MRKTIKFVIILIVITTMIMLYSRYVATRGLITKEYAILDNIPDSYDGLKIIHFSDIHYGRIISDEELKKVIYHNIYDKPEKHLFLEKCEHKEIKFMNQIGG